MGYNGLSRQSKIRQEIPLPLKQTQAPEEACFLVNYSLKQEPTKGPASEQGATKCLGLRHITKCPEQMGTLTFIWSFYMECDVMLAIYVRTMRA